MKQGTEARRILDGISCRTPHSVPVRKAEPGPPFWEQDWQLNKPLPYLATGLPCFPELARQMLLEQFPEAAGLERIADLDLPQQEILVAAVASIHGPSGAINLIDSELIDDRFSPVRKMLSKDVTERQRQRRRAVMDIASTISMKVKEPLSARSTGMAAVLLHISIYIALLVFSFGIARISSLGQLPGGNAIPFLMNIVAFWIISLWLNPFRRSRDEQLPVWLAMFLCIREADRTLEQREQERNQERAMRRRRQGN
ncbi:MAG: hypothetical protein H7A35_14230 [Planctomycetales bacterium]|nr:hypothetical protein [bacterium]UNM07994.1 MAG: hypothetical protein H7A35_14230 [Planctomycetales bacterium]